MQVAQSERSPLCRRIFVQNAQKFSTCEIFFVHFAQNPRKCGNVENYVENVEMLKTFSTLHKEKVDPNFCLKYTNEVN